LAPGAFFWTPLFPLPGLASASGELSVALRAPALAVATREAPVSTDENQGMAVARALGAHTPPSAEAVAGRARSKRWRAITMTIALWRIRRRITRRPYNPDEFVARHEIRFGPDGFSWQSATKFRARG